jgi:hypothetical protein
MEGKNKCLRSLFRGLVSPCEIREETQDGGQCAEPRLVEVPGVPRVARQYEIKTINKNRIERKFRKEIKERKKEMCSLDLSVASSRCRGCVNCRLVRQVLIKQLNKQKKSRV